MSGPAGRTRLDVFFSDLKENGRTAFMPYVTAGYPSLGAMAGIMEMLADARADCLELGIPFSDPVADGATIQNSSKRALESGVTPDAVLGIAELAARKGHRVILMSYANPIHSAGLEKAAARAGDAGVQGLVVPDLPLEEAAEWKGVFGRKGIALSLFAAPTTSSLRLSRIDRMTGGFIYYVSLLGVTGERTKMPPSLPTRLRAIRRGLTHPLCVGFGVSTCQQAAALARVCDGVIVGSALVRRLADWGGSVEKRREIGAWVRSMAGAVKGALTY